jgi:hypothetical protein
MMIGAAVGSVVGLLSVIVITIVVVRRNRMRQVVLDEPDPYPNDVIQVQTPLSGRGKERISRQAIEDLTRTGGGEGTAFTSDLEARGTVTSERLRNVDERSQSNTGDHEAELASVIIRALRMFRRRDDENGAAPPAYAGQ